MRIGYLLTNFSPLSESFIRREILGLCERGHRIFVYAQYLHREALAPLPIHSLLEVRQVDFLNDAGAAAESARQDSIEHLHASLMLEAQLAAWRTADALAIPFTITAYSGYSVFTARDTDTYRGLSRDPLCGGIVAEDPFMSAWLTERLGADATKIHLIANALDLKTYRLTGSRPAHRRVRILAIARSVPKKGLLHLVRAFAGLRRRRDDIELKLIGDGPEEGKLRDAARDTPDIEFLGSRPEAECRQAYRDADIFCLPCVRTAEGDADGVPTTILEAMAYELPIVASDLLSLPYYVRHEHEGLLAPPHDESELARHLETLIDRPELRGAMGRAGRARVEELCDLSRNLSRLENLFQQTRRGRWQQCMSDLSAYRAALTAERRAFHSSKFQSAVQYFQPNGRFLDIGCGNAQMRSWLAPGVAYVGCDPKPTASVESGAVVVAAFGEALPFADETFDCALLKSVLSYSLDIDRTLAEAARVLKPGGRLFLHECVNDSNPIHLNHYTDRDLRARLNSCIDEVDFRFEGSSEVVLAIARKRPARMLAGIAIATFNRAAYLRQCIDSSLAQTYGSVAIAVFDDGSTDETPAILASYGNRIVTARSEVNRGIAAAKNSALRLIPEDARFVSILDSDDLMDPKFIERCVAHLEANPDAGLVYVDDVVMDADGRGLFVREAVEPWNLDAWLRTGELRGDAWLARRQLVMSTGLHDERLPADVDFDLFYQLAERCEFTHLAEPLLFVREHAGRSARQESVLARCHAANLVKFGYSPEYAFLRARKHPEWIPAIEEGIELGRRMRRTAKQTADDAAPVRERFLPFGTPHIGQDEIDLVVATLRSGWIGTGPLTAQFEQEFAAYTGAEHAIALNSCTAGLFLTLRAMDIGPGDEVITTPLTFAATANVIEHSGARPVFADIDPVTFNLDPDSVASRITQYTRAIMPVHFGGMPCDLDGLRALAERHGVLLIEDAAHAIGARFHGKSVGSGPNPAVFSFYANKNLTTAEGGMVTTNDAHFARRLRVLREHGLSTGSWNRFSSGHADPPDLLEPGYKFNMPDFAAALGLPQLRKQEEMLALRQSYAARYDQAFRDLPLDPQRRIGESGERHSLHLYAIRLRDGFWNVGRDVLVRALRAENIGATVHYPLVPRLRYYREKYAVPVGSLPKAESVADTILSLPLSSAMSVFDADDVIEAVRKTARRHASFGLGGQAEQGSHGSDRNVSVGH